jgi:hypothetical protein
MGRPGKETANRRRKKIYQAVLKRLRVAGEIFRRDHLKHEAFNERAMEVRKIYQSLKPAMAFSAEPI